MNKGEIKNKFKDDLITQSSGYIGIYSVPLRSGIVEYFVDWDHSMSLLTKLTREGSNFITYLVESNLNHNAPYFGFLGSTDTWANDVFVKAFDYFKELCNAVGGVSSGWYYLVSDSGEKVIVDRGGKVVADVLSFRYFCSDNAYDVLSGNSLKGASFRIIIKECRFVPLFVFEKFCKTIRKYNKDSNVIVGGINGGAKYRNISCEFQSKNGRVSFIVSDLVGGTTFGASDAVDIFPQFLRGEIKIMFERRVPKRYRRTYGGLF